MDLSGKGFSPAHNFLQNASSLVSAYGLGSSLMAGHTPLTTSLFSAGTNHTLTNPAYSGSIGTTISPSHNSFSNGHSISSQRQIEKSADGPTKSQIYASPAPVFNRHKDSFPYGISGVPMPNYGYHGDVYQFTSNGYPRKSRTCTYCGKVFTRSTTRRYHEKRCPLLRAAVSSYMGEENSGAAVGTGVTTSPQQARGRTGDMITTHSYKGPGQSLGPSLSGISRSNESQEIATSMLLKTPPGERNASGESLLGGYQTSVIVKQEPHELEASSTSNSSNKHSVQSQEHLSESVLRFSPQSNASSGNKFDSNENMSPGYHSGIDLTKSPSHTSLRDENTSVLSDDYIREQYKLRSEERSEGENDIRQVPPHHGSQDLSRYSQSRYRIARDDDLMGDEEEERNGENEDMEDGSDIKDGDDSNLGQGEISDVESGEIMEEDVDLTSTDKKDGKELGSHKCGICGKCFESSGKLHLHEQLHTKFKPYACKFCGQKFAKSAQRIEHEKTHNGMESLHMCAVCGSSFTRKYSLKLHMRRWHQEGPWLCRHCGKASLTQSELKTHLYSHNLPRMERESLLYMPDVPNSYNAASPTESSGQENGPPYSNNVDSGVVSEGGSASTSMDAQNKQEMEMCHECGRDFPKGYMRYHLKSHEAQKPYSCPICAKRFGYKNNMKSHIKLHTGVKPFQCKMCGAKFTRGSTLRRHARRHGIIADSVWDLFIKPDYSKAGGGATRSSKLDKLSTSNAETNVTAANQISTNSGGSGTGESTNYLVSTISPTPSHGSLYPLYASLGQIPPVPGIYPGLSATTSYIAQHLPHSSTYAASASSHPQMDALNLSLQKAATATADQHSDQSSFSNVSAERSRSRSRSLSGSDTRRLALQVQERKPDTADAEVQVHTCCPPVTPAAAGTDAAAAQEPPPAMLEVDTLIPKKSSPFEPADIPTTPQQQLPETPSPLAVVPYIVTSPSQRPSNLDSTSPALSSSSGKDYSLETISSLIGSGRMFKCFHCECYFSEYAMYRIHAKLHNRDFTRPFVCLVCGEDCHDRVYFALHLSEHLR